MGLQLVLSKQFETGWTNIFKFVGHRIFVQPVSKYLWLQQKIKLAKYLSIQLKIVVSAFRKLFTSNVGFGTFGSRSV